MITALSAAIITPHLRPITPYQSNYDNSPQAAIITPQQPLGFAPQAAIITTAQRRLEALVCARDF